MHFLEKMDGYRIFVRAEKQNIQKNIIKHGLASHFLIQPARTLCD